MDGSADATSEGGDLSGSEAADETLDSANDGDVSDLDALSDDGADAAPAEKSKTEQRAAPPKTPEKKTDDKSKTSDADKQAIAKFEKIAGFRVHPDDVDKIKKLTRGAYGAFEKAAELERLFKPENREELFKKLGLDADSFAAERLSKRLEEKLETPEEKAQRERDKELEELRADKKKRAAEDEQRANDEITTREKARINREWTDALSKSDLPRRPELLRRMAEVTKDYLLKKSIEPPIEHVIEIVKEERNALRAETFKADILDPDEARFAAFMQALPEAAHKRIRGYYVAQVRRPTGAANTTQQAAPAATQRRAAKAPLSVDDWRREMDL